MGLKPSDNGLKSTGQTPQLYPDPSQPYSQPYSPPPTSSYPGTDEVSSGTSAQYQQPQYGQPQYGQPQPQYGQPQPQYAQPQYGQPVFAQPVTHHGAPVQPVAVVVGGSLSQNHWSDGICDCFSDCGNALIACLLPPLRLGWTVERSRLNAFWQGFFYFGIFWVITVVFSGLQRHFNRVPNSDNTTQPWLAWPIFLGCVGMIVVGTHYRIRLRFKYQIPGNNCEDCLCHTFCKCCAIAQEGRHVDRASGRLASSSQLPV